MFIAIRRAYWRRRLCGHQWSVRRPQSVHCCIIQWREKKKEFCISLPLCQKWNSFLLWFNPLLCVPSLLFVCCYDAAKRDFDCLEFSSLLNNSLCYAWPTPSINKYCREAYRRRSQEPDERFHATDGVSVVVKARDLLLSTLREDSRALIDKGGDVSGGKRKTPFLHRQACSFHRLV